MKAIASLVIVLSLVGSYASAASAAHSSNSQLSFQCGFETETYDAGTDVIHWEISSPKGTCDHLGLLQEKSVIDCRNAAQTRGYDCFQVTTWKRGVDRSPDTPFKACFACIK